jgi:hypothetical protein
MVLLIGRPCRGIAIDLDMPFKPRRGKTFLMRYLKTPVLPFSQTGTKLLDNFRVGFGHIMVFVWIIFVIVQLNGWLLLSEIPGVAVAVGPNGDALFEITVGHIAPICRFSFFQEAAEAFSIQICRCFHPA